MSRFFDRCSPMAEIERQMTMIPDFAPRGYGSTVLCRYRPSAADVDCRNCLQHRRRGCRSLTCLYLSERLEAGTVTMEELIAVRKRTETKTDDNMDHTRTPFIQANSMERIISLLENMYENPMTPQQVAELMDFDLRQSDYYYNAGKYLGLFEKAAEDKQIVISLTELGNSVFRLNYKQRQMKLVELILEHQIFGTFFDRMVKTGQLAQKDEIADEMRRLHVCNEGQIVRRASSVLGWLKWIRNLTKL